eukprot:785670_1
MQCSLCKKCKRRCDYTTSQIRKGANRKCRECTAFTMEQRGHNKSYQWMKCTACPLTSTSHLCDVIPLNNGTFIVFSKIQRCLTFTLRCHKYNTISNKWTMLCDKIIILNNNTHLTIATSMDHNDVYLFTIHGSTIHLIKFKLRTPWLMETLQLNHNINNIHPDAKEIHMSSLYVYDHLHLMIDNTHFVWSMKQPNYLKKCMKFKDLHSDLGIYVLKKVKLFHSRSRNGILLLCHLSFMMIQTVIEMWCYSMENKRWTKWGNEVKTSWDPIFGSYLLSKDERYVIKLHCFETWMLDIESRKLCKMQLIWPPKVMDCKAVCMSDETLINMKRKLVSGLFYGNCKAKGALIVMDVLNLIVMWCGDMEQLIHVIGDDGQHYKINIESMLHSKPCRN